MYGKWLIGWFSKPFHHLQDTSQECGGTFSLCPNQYSCNIIRAAQRHARQCNSFISTQSRCQMFIYFTIGISPLLYVMSKRQSTAPHFIFDSNSKTNGQCHLGEQGWVVHRLIVICRFPSQAFHYPDCFFIIDGSSTQSNSTFDAKYTVWNSFWSWNSFKIQKDGSTLPSQG